MHTRIMYVWELNCGRFILYDPWRGVFFLGNFFGRVLVYLVSIHGLVIWDVSVAC